MKYIAILTILIFSCKPKDGVIVGKHYEPKTEMLMMLPMKIGETTIIMPFVFTDNEDFVFCIQSDNGFETVYVNRKQYECLKVGDHFKPNEDCSLTDNNNKKRQKK